MGLEVLRIGDIFAVSRGYKGVSCGDLHEFRRAIQFSFSFLEHERSLSIDLMHEFQPAYLVLLSPWKPLLT